MFPDDGMQYTHEIPLSHFFLKEVQLDYRHPKLINDAGNPFELDIYIPTKKQAFEYQGNFVSTLFPAKKISRRTTLQSWYIQR